MCLQWYNSNNWCVVRWMALLSEIYVFLNLTVWWLLRDIEDSISAFYNEQFIGYKIIFIWSVVLASVTRKDSKKECVFTFKVEDFKVKGMLTKEPEEGKFMLTSSNARWDTTKNYFWLLKKCLPCKKGVSFEDQLRHFTKRLLKNWGFLTIVCGKFPYVMFLRNGKKFGIISWF